MKNLRARSVFKMLSNSFTGRVVVSLEAFGILMLSISYSPANESCGDNVCDPELRPRETCSSCPTDCGPCPPRPPQSTCQSPARGDIALFEHDNFRGRCVVLSPGRYQDDRAMGFPHDEASSVRLGSGSAVQVCEHSFFEGVCEVLDRSDSNFGDNPIRHDRVSSVVVLGEGHGPFDCRILAETPQFEPAARVISGSGSRGPLCFRGANVEVLLRQYRRWWFDRTLASDQKRGTAATVPVRYECRGRESQMVYVETRANGRKIQSRRVPVSLCR